MDILKIYEVGIQKNLTKGIISLARQAKCTLMFSLTPVIENTHFKRTKLLRALYRLFLMAKPASVSYIQGMGTGNSYKMRGPREYIAILTGLLKIPEKHAKNIIGSNVENLVLRFIKRYYDLLIESDVEIVNIKGGELK